MPRIGLRLVAVWLLVALAAGCASAALQISWGPTLGALTPNSFRLTWFTNVPSLGTVEIADQTLARGGPVRAHEAEIRGLSPNTEYQYRLVVEAGEEVVRSRWYSLVTPSADLSRFTFCVYSDSQDTVAIHKQVAAGIASLQPRFVLHCGDLTHDGNDLQLWKRFFPVALRYAASAPLFTTLGNHEHEADLYFSLLPLPPGGGRHGGQWYRAIFGSVQIFSLDLNESVAEQSRWLQRVLQEPRPPGVQWRVAIFHQPPYTSGPHEPSQTARRYFCPYLENGGVDLVFNGHNHTYERSLARGLNYLTMGSAGGALYRPNLQNPYRQAGHRSHGFARVVVSPEALQVSWFDTQLKEYDRFQVSR